MKRTLILIAALGLTACQDEKNPYSLDEMRADAKLAQAEAQACDAGKYDGKAWKQDHCAQARAARSHHEIQGAMLPYKPFGEIKK